MTEAYTDATASIEVTEVPSTSLASKMIKLVKLKKNVVKAKEGFTALRKPYRTPLPAAPMAQGYAEHIAAVPPPDDATSMERFRDLLLKYETHPIFGYLMILWAIGVVIVFIVFAGCMFYLWPMSNDENDFWQERMTQFLSGLFTYSVLIPYPWRLSITLHLYSSRCTDKPVGVDFYGRPTDMLYFHIPRKTRGYIATLLQLNTWVQLLHQFFHIIWNTYESFSYGPHAILFNITMVGGFCCGAGGAIVQLIAERKLYVEHPGKFPPNVLVTFYEMKKRHDEGGESWCSLIKELTSKAPQKKKAPAGDGAPAP